jgi:hypothetical protein
VRKIADKDIEGLDLSSWRAALNGAEPVNPETLERFAARFARYGFRREAQLPVYGLAEASLAVTVPPLGRGPLVDRVERETFTARGEAVPATGNSEPVISFVSSGRVVAGHEIRIVDEKGNEVADRTEGYLWFRGPIGHQRVLPERGGNQGIVPGRPSGGPRRTRVGEFRGSRVPRGRGVLRHRTGEGHHYQGRTKSVSTRSGRVGGARGGNSKGLHRGVRAEG